MPTEYIVLTIIIIFIASFVQGFSGFGFALLTVPTLSIFLDLKFVVPLAALCGFYVNIYLAYVLRKKIRINEAKELVYGALIGVPLGAMVITSFNKELLLVFLSLLVLIFVFFSLTNIIQTRKINYKWKYLAGFLSGLFGGAFNTNGPPILIYYYLSGYSKEKFKASLTGYFVFSSIIIVSSHYFSGMTTLNVLKFSIYLLPAIILGKVLGHKYFGKVSSNVYNKIVLFTLAIIGTYLLITNLIHI